MKIRKEKIYLLPGLMCNEKLWTQLQTTLQDEYELVHVPIPLEKDIEAMVKALSASLPNESINLLGFSLGGYLASYFAVHFPQKIKRLFIMACSSCALKDEEIEKRQEVLSFIDKHGFKGLSRKKVQSLLDEEHQNNDDVMDIIQSMYTQLGEEVFKTQIKSTLYRKDLMQALMQLRVPLYFYYAQYDRLVDSKWLDAVAHKNISCVKVKRNSHSHMLPLEYPLEVSQAIRDWMQKTA